jgi:lipopolysaccharide/colanic/teichoic acid biosynthesis glycosyltransferase
LIAFAPLIFIIAISVYFILGIPPFFTQIRVGKKGRLFKIYKFRTLKNEREVMLFPPKSQSIFLNFLRTSKLDELPQLLNILRGQMSFVGPRPDIEGYADLLQGADRKLLLIKPGLTGPASLKYKNEDIILSKQKDPLKYNDTVIWPDKVQINLDYMANYTFSGDIAILIKSLIK